jgi:hypothetical protein
VSHLEPTQTRQRCHSEGNDWHAARSTCAEIDDDSVGRQRSESRRWAMPGASGVNGRQSLPGVNQGALAAASNFSHHRYWRPLGAGPRAMQRPELIRIIRKSLQLPNPATPSRTIGCWTSFQPRLRGVCSCEGSFLKSDDSHCRPGLRLASEICRRGRRVRIRSTRGGSRGQSRSHLAIDR